MVARPELPEFHPRTILRDWGSGHAFRLADALTGVCVFGATGSGKTSGPAKHLAYGYLAAGFGGLVLCAKKEERRQWQAWAAETGRADDLVIIDAGGKWRFNFIDWEASRPEEGGGLAINIVNLLDEIAGAISGGGGPAEGGRGDNKFWEDALHHLNTNLVELVLLAGLQISFALLRSIVTTASDRDPPRVVAETTSSGKTHFTISTPTWWNSFYWLGCKSPLPCSGPSSLRRHTHPTRPMI